MDEAFHNDANDINIVIFLQYFKNHIWLYNQMLHGCYNSYRTSKYKFGDKMRLTTAVMFCRLPIPLVTILRASYMHLHDAQIYMCNGVAYFSAQARLYMHETFVVSLSKDFCNSVDSLKNRVYTWAFLSIICFNVLHWHCVFWVRSC